VLAKCERRAQWKEEIKICQDIAREEGAPNCANCYWSSKKLVLVVCYAFVRRRTWRPHDNVWGHVRKQNGVTVTVWLTREIGEISSSSYEKAVQERKMTKRSGSGCNSILWKCRLHRVTISPGVYLYRLRQKINPFYP
jgi:hypothetical protein